MNAWPGFDDIFNLKIFYLLHSLLSAYSIQYMYSVWFYANNSVIEYKRKRNFHGWLCHRPHFTQRHVNAHPNNGFLTVNCWSLFNLIRKLNFLFKEQNKRERFSTFQKNIIDKLKETKRKTKKQIYRHFISFLFLLKRHNIMKTIAIDHVLNEVKIYLQNMNGLWAWFKSISIVQYLWPSTKNSLNNQKSNEK